MTYLTAQEARTLSTLNSHHRGDSITKSLESVLEQAKAAALKGNRETTIDHLKAEKELSELMEALHSLGFLARTVRGADDTYVMRLSW